MATFEGLMKKDYGDDFENKFVKVKNKILSANKNDKVLIARADAIVETIFNLKLDIDSLSAAYAYPFILGMPLILGVTLFAAKTAVDEEHFACSEKFVENADSQSL